MPTAVQTIIFEKELAKNIFPDNSYIRFSRNDDKNVKSGEVVLPQSGAKPTVQLNRLGGSVGTERLDSVVKYPIHEFTTDVITIKDFDEMTISYAKRVDIIEDHREELYTQICNYTNYTWAPTSTNFIVPTTGGNRPLGIAPNATGTRKSITLKDFKKANAILDKLDIPKEGRVALLDSDMLDDLLDDPKVTSKDYVSTPNLENGSIGKLLGVSIYIRSKVVAYDNVNVPKSPFAAGASTDDAASFIWHPKFVRFAFSGVKVYLDVDLARAYGSEISAMAMTGSSKSYTNGRGIVAIREAK